MNGCLLLGGRVQGERTRVAENQGLSKSECVHTIRSCERANASREYHFYRTHNIFLLVHVDSQILSIHKQIIGRRRRYQRPKVILLCTLNWSCVKYPFQLCLCWSFVNNQSCKSWYALCIWPIILWWRQRRLWLNEYLSSHAHALYSR